MKTYRIAVSALALAGLAAASVAQDAENEDGFVSLFDGKSLEGWKVSENPGTFSVKDGAIVAKGPRAHAFYVGDVKDGKFKDFELRLDVMTEENSNGGVYFHTEYQEDGWPSEGYEVQVNNTHSDPRKTGGLYAVQDNEKPFKDHEWMRYRIRVEGKNIKVWVNDKPLVDYTEKTGDDRREDQKGRLLKPEGGTIALQGHDPDSVVHYKNIRIKPL